MKRIFFSLTTVLGLVFTTARADDLAIIVAKNSALANMTSAELAKIFRAEKAKGPDGVKLVLAVPAPGAPERAAMLAGIYEMDEAAYGKYFLQATFTGLVATAPKQLAGAALVAFAAGTPGGITCVKAGDVTGDVKIVKVDGHAPGEADYKLKIK